MKKVNVTTEDRKKVDQLYSQGKPGFYLTKGGNSFEEGPAFDSPYSQFDPDEGAMVIYSNHENDVYGFLVKKYGEWEMDNAEDYMNYTCTEIDEDGDHNCYNW